MRIIPVIDLEGGQVVRAVAGERQNYRAIVSQLVRDSTPAAVARALASRFSFSTAYVADLDAIGGAEPDWDSVRAISRAGLRVYLDAGVNYSSRAKQIAAFDDGAPVAGIVVGLESCADPRHLAACLTNIEPALAIFSLDLKHGQPLANSGWRGCSPLELARTAVDAGFRRVIVLDLANVGTNAGPSVATLCRDLSDRHPQIELIAGGGIRNLADLRSLHESGCHAALVASALHDGRITAADVDQVAAW